MTFNDYFPIYRVGNQSIVISNPNHSTEKKTRIITHFVLDLGNGINQLTGKNSRLKRKRARTQAHTHTHLHTHTRTHTHLYLEK